MDESKDIEKLVEKIIKGVKDFSKEELQLYVNHSGEIERRLLESLEGDAPASGL